VVSSGLHLLFCSILHWGSRRSARDRNFGSRILGRGS
jgi:hypothetical protein